MTQSIFLPMDDLPEDKICLQGTHGLGEIACLPLPIIQIYLHLFGCTQVGRVWLEEFKVILRYIVIGQTQNPLLYQNEVQTGVPVVQDGVMPMQLVFEQIHISGRQSGET